MEILARAVGRRKEAVAQVQLVLGTGKFIINNKEAESYLQYNNFSLLKIKSPFEVLLLDNNNEKTLNDSIIATNNTDKETEILSTQKNIIHQNSKIDTIVKVKGGGLIGQVDAIKLALTRALCKLDQNLTLLTDAFLTTEPRKVFKLKGFLTQDSRIKERRKYGLKKARKAPQYSKR